MAPRLDEIAESLAMLQGTERLEALAEFGRSLPELPESMQRLRDQGIGLVHECQSPVFVMGEIHAEVLRIFVDAPREAPVARGFAGLMVHAFGHRPVNEILEAPERILDTLHLAPLLSMRRTRGLYGIFGRLRGIAGQHSEGEPGVHGFVG